MTTAVDTNILLDILIPNLEHLETSLKKLEIASAKGDVIICEIVYSELASQFPTLSALNDFLNDMHIDLLLNNKASLFKASRLWLMYVRKSPHQSFCKECGKLINVNCPLCESRLSFPRRMLNDFIIGAHAMTFSDVFLTRDSGFFKKYFSELKIN